MSTGSSRTTKLIYKTPWSVVSACNRGSGYYTPGIEVDPRMNSDLPGESRGVNSPGRGVSVRTTLAALAVAGAVVAGLTLPAVGTAAADEGDVLVVQPTVSPAQPTTDENFTVTARLTNVAETGNDRYYVESVAVRNGSDESSTLYGRNDDFQAVLAGETTGQPVEVDVDEPGNRTLYLHTELQLQSGETVDVVRPLSLVVRDRHPSMSLTASGVGPAGETQLNLTVANGLETDIRGLTVDVSATNTTVEDNQRVGASLTPGDARTFRFTGTETVAGPQTATVTLSYATPDGDQRTVTRELSAVAPEPEAVDPSLDLTADPVGVSGETALSVTVVNPRESPVRAAAVELEADSLELAEDRQLRPRVDGGSEATYTFETGQVTPGEKTVQATLTYTTADGTERRVTEQLSATIERVDNPGNVSLTGLRVTQQSGRLSVRGSASNVGGTNVSGVVVSVADGDGVGPAQSEARFFVGNVPGGDFTSFEVNGQLRTPNASSVTIPLRVSYVTDGVRTERVVEVPYRPQPDRPTSQPEGGGPPLVAVGAALLAVGGVALGWRRLRG